MKHTTLVALFTAGLLSPAATTFAQTPQTAGYLDRFEGEFAKIQVNGHQQLLHRSGKVTVDKLEQVSYYRIASAVKNGAYGAINRKGDIIAPFRYDAVRVFGENKKDNPEENYCLITIKLQGKTGAVDSLGNVLCQPEYSDIAVLTPKTFSIKKNGLYGWCDMKTGKVLQEPKYEEVSPSYVPDRAILIKSQGKFGLALEDGTVLVPPKYERFIGWNNNGQLFSYYVPGGKCGLIDRQGKILTPAVYDDITEGPADNLVAVTQQGRIGLLDVATGKLKIPLQYTKVSRMGPLFQVWKGALCGLTDTTGKEVVPVTHTEIRMYDSKGSSIFGALPLPLAYAPPYYVVAKKGDAAALYDASGKQLLPFDYTDIGVLPINDKVYVVPVKGTLCGVADFSGKLLVPVQFEGLATKYGMSNYDDDAAGVEKNNFISVMKGEKTGLFNIVTGQLVIPATYSNIRWQNAEMLRLEQGDSSALADKTGKILRPLTRYGAFDAVSPNLIVERRYTDDNGITLLINKQGQILYQNKSWEFAASSYNRLLAPDSNKTRPLQFNSGLLKVRANAHENQFVDSTGKLVVFDQYTYVGDFSNGVAVALNQEKRVGIININKKEVYPLVLDDMASADDELVQMKQGNKVGLLRKDGSVLLPLEYEDINRIYDTSLYIVTRNGKKGVLNAKGKELLPADYDEIRYNKDTQFFDVTKDGKEGMMSIDGTAIVPPVYDDLEQNQDWGTNSRFPVLVKKGEWYLYLDEQGNSLPWRAKKKKGYGE
ncbi:WG repeat-containing protein [Chitinophaga varians]|uniref:WG repeat-containing protein n=1 Tax=Chitinophaga varians TaxID=2202339 RepID=UPI00165F9E58|nr:WG repeat-containing protein [Chitinophaga varians]MBC9914908.1 WG repeat-containing protein [Chitinophaga varians]